VNLFDVPSAAKDLVRTFRSRPVRCVRRLQAPHRPPPLGLAPDNVPVDSPATRARQRRTPSEMGCRAGRTTCTSRSSLGKVGGAITDTGCIAGINACLGNMLCGKTDMCAGCGGAAAVRAVLYVTRSGMFDDDRGVTPQRLLLNANTISSPTRARRPPRARPREWPDPTLCMRMCIVHVAKPCAQTLLVWSHLSFVSY
jgi:hypothetical protein